jgi:superfamily II DNA or RNA helicase
MIDLDDTPPPPPPPVAETPLATSLFELLPPEDRAAPRRMNLRPYQQECVESVLKELKAARSVLYVLATGLGKTVIAAHLAKSFQHGRILFLAHRQELIYQARRTFEAVLGETPEIEMADQWADSRARVVISTIQTQAGSKGGRRERFNPSDFSLLIADESHHAVADSWQATIDYYKQNSDLRVVGMTATPDRADEEALGKVFESVAFEYELPDAINDGWLVPLETQQITVEDIDFSQIRTTAGDLNGADLEAVMMSEKALHGIADPLYSIAKGKQTLVFASSVAHAETLCEILNRHAHAEGLGECARWICGKTDEEERARTLADFENRSFDFLCNCAIATEGFDAPGIEVIAMARPTKSRALYSQMLGRGTRTLPGVVDGPETPEARRQAIAQSAKTHLLVLDWTGNTGRHQLISAVDVLAGKYSEATVKAAKELLKGESHPLSAEEALRRAEIRLAEEERKRAEAAQRALVIGKATFTATTNRPFATLGIQVESRGWDKPATPSQLQYLERCRFEQKEPLTAAQAQAMIGEIQRRRKAGLCTVKQAACLKRAGMNENMSFSQAKEIMDRLASNGWRWPQNKPLPEWAKRSAGVA